VEPMAQIVVPAPDGLLQQPMPQLGPVLLARLLPDVPPPPPEPAAATPPVPTAQRVPPMLPMPWLAALAEPVADAPAPRVAQEDIPPQPPVPPVVVDAPPPVADAEGPEVVSVPSRARLRSIRVRGRAVCLTLPLPITKTKSPRISSGHSSKHKPQIPTSLRPLPLAACLPVSPGLCIADRSSKPIPMPQSRPSHRSFRLFSPRPC